MTLLRMVNDITYEFDNKNYSMRIFIDLSKAFHTADHKFFINKLYHYGVKGTVLQWFTNYLANRIQYVLITKQYKFGISTS